MTFKSGNFNNFENLIYNTLPSIRDLIRYDLLPQIESTLKKMLDSLDGISGNNIEIKQLLGKEELEGFYCSISYEVNAFKVPEAPDKAVEEDTETLTKALTREDIHLKKIKIDVSTGIFSVEYEIPLNKEDK